MRDDGNIDYLYTGDVALLVIDERMPPDRVYLMTRETPREEIAALIGDSPIGYGDYLPHPDEFLELQATLSDARSNS
jgi:hypothetical protein